MFLQILQDQCNVDENNDIAFILPMTLASGIDIGIGIDVDIDNSIGIGNDNGFDI